MQSTYEILRIWTYRHTNGDEKTTVLRQMDFCTVNIYSVCVPRGLCSSSSVPATAHHLCLCPRWRAGVGASRPRDPLGSKVKASLSSAPPSHSTKEALSTPPLMGQRKAELSWPSNHSASFWFAEADFPLWRELQLLLWGYSDQASLHLRKNELHVTVRGVVTICVFIIVMLCLFFSLLP